MFKFSKAAILVAVFLLMITSGCYTKLKTTKVNILPEAVDSTVVETADETEWDFGWGWYDPEWGYDNSYYIYYHVNWWDQCSWCNDDDETPDIETFNATGKIPHRDDNTNIPSTEVTTDNSTSLPSVQVKTTPTTSDKGTSTTINNNNTKSKSSESDNNESKSESKTKTKKKKGRR